MGQIAFTLAYTHIESGAPFAFQYWWDSAHVLIKEEREKGEKEKKGKGEKVEKKKRIFVIFPYLM